MSIVLVVETPTEPVVVQRRDQLIRHDLTYTLVVRMNLRQQRTDVTGERSDAECWSNRPEAQHGVTELSLPLGMNL